MERGLGLVMWTDGVFWDIGEAWRTLGRRFRVTTVAFLKSGDM